MTRFVTVILFSVIVIISACHKNSSGEEYFLYGTWVKGSNFGDTLRFYNKNGKNFIAISTFNSAFPAPTEKEYTFRNNKLTIQLYGSNDHSTIQSFKWKQTGKEFEIQGIELFSFMSSTLTYFTYHKIQ